MYLILCRECRHFQVGTTGEHTMACAAFPHRIPVAILQAAFDHHHPYPGDHGIQFEPKGQPEKRG